MSASLLNIHHFGSHISRYTSTSFRAHPFIAYSPRCSRKLLLLLSMLMLWLSSIATVFIHGVTHSHYANQRKCLSVSANVKAKKSSSPHTYTYSRHSLTMGKGLGSLCQWHFDWMQNYFPLNNPLRAYFKSHSIAPFLCYWHRYVYHSVQDTLLHRHYQSTTTTERQVGQGRAREQTGNFSEQNSCTLKGNCTCLPRLYWTKIPLEFAIIMHDHKSRRKQKTLINFPPI